MTMFLKLLPKQDLKSGENKSQLFLYDLNFC